LQKVMPKRARVLALGQSLRPDLVRYVYWLSRDWGLAEDVVQETLLRAWKARYSMLDEASAKIWFFSMARREYARFFRRKRHVMAHVDEPIAREKPMLAAAKDEDPAEIREALFKVPRRYREPLVMQVLMGFSTSEIAAGLELSHAAVLMRLFRGRQQLRALCGEDTDSDPPGSAGHATGPC
jgi:RNA polymerase sigma-70 factor (ECF subfamily)